MSHHDTQKGLTVSERSRRCLHCSAARGQFCKRADGSIASASHAIRDYPIKHGRAVGLPPSWAQFSGAVERA